MTRTILIVDDTKDLRENLKDSLEIEGFRVLTARNGKDAITILIDTIPHLIITDLVMPVLDGYDLIRAVRKNNLWKDVPIIVYSAVSIPETAAGVVDLGADHFINKPSTIDHLLESIEKILAKK